MSLCRCVRRRWHAFKNIVYGYEEETYNYRIHHETDPWQVFASEQQNRHVHFTEKGNDRHVSDEYKECSDNWSNYCIPKRQVYEAYGIVFETREERDAFESKMECMETILEKELHDIRQQHVRLREERTAIPRSKAKNTGKPGQKAAKLSKSDSGRRHDFTGTRETPNYSAFLRTDDNPLAEEVSLVNEVQDVLDQMYNLSKELNEIEKILCIEVRERTLYPEPRLIQIKAPEDALSQQMKNDGGFRYCSSDSSLQRISYDTLPPPLTLSELLAKQPQGDT